MPAQRFTQIIRPVLLSMLSLLGAPQSGVTAAPVTLRFDAVVHAVSLGVPFDSGINVSPGDIIRGRFTFNADDAGEQSSQVSVQPYGAVIVIDEVEFRTPASKPDLTLQSNDNLIFDVDADDPAAGPSFERDALAVGSSLGPSNGQVTPNISPHRSSFRLSLHGDPTILGAAALPADSAVWNAFNLERQIHVSIRGAERGVEGFDATVGSFVAIPEPTSLQELFLLLLIALITLGKRCRLETRLRYCQRYRRVRFGDPRRPAKRGYGDAALKAFPGRA